MRARLTGASGKRTIWRLRSRVEEENGESKGDSVEGVGKSRRVGWACQLVDILNGKLPRPSLQSAAVSEGRDRRPSKKRARLCMCIQSVPEVAFFPNHGRQKSKRTERRSIVLELRTTDDRRVFANCDFPRDTGESALYSLYMVFVSTEF